MGVIEHPPIFHLPWSWTPDHVTYTWLVMIILAGLAFAASRKVALVPRGAQNLMEVVLEQFLTLIDDVMGPEGRRYLPLIATLGLFIFASNLIGIVPGTTGPTANLNTTAACAIIVFVAYHAIGIRKIAENPDLPQHVGPHQPKDCLAIVVHPNEFTKALVGFESMFFEIINAQEYRDFCS